MIKLNNRLKLFIKYLVLIQMCALCESNTRIIGGTPTTIDKAKYLVQLTNDGSIICGGTLIGEKHVVTAAHCFDRSPQKLRIVGGATRITDRGVRSKISKIMIPQDYNKDTLYADIAVIELRSALKGDLIQPTEICKNDWGVGDPVQLFGWGKRAEDATSIPIQLHTVNVTVTDTNWCKSTYRSTRNITDAMFCAAACGKDACSGDSGGPVMVNREFCGVTSWGEGCGRSDFPGVYTDVKKFKKFIQNAMRKECIKVVNTGVLRKE